MEIFLWSRIFLQLNFNWLTGLLSKIITGFIQQVPWHEPFKLCLIFWRKQRRSTHDSTSCQQLWLVLPGKFLEEALHIFKDFCSFLSLFFFCFFFFPFLCVCVWKGVRACACDFVFVFFRSKKWPIYPLLVLKNQNIGKARVPRGQLPSSVWCVV